MQVEVSREKEFLMKIPGNEKKMQEADEKKMQGEVSWEKEFLMKLSLVLQLSRNMEPTIVTHTCKKVLTKKLQGLQKTYSMR